MPSSSIGTRWPAPDDDGARADNQVLTPVRRRRSSGRPTGAGTLLTAIQNAATAAAGRRHHDDGELWRCSPDFQQRLLDNAIQTYGSFAARQYVQTPAASKHVTGRPSTSAGTPPISGLIANGSRFRLCQIYANEAWYFELGRRSRRCLPAVVLTRPPDGPGRHR